MPNTTINKNLQNRSPIKNQDASYACFSSEISNNSPIKYYNEITMREHDFSKHFMAT
jgi:hypothetical protein